MVTDDGLEKVGTVYMKCLYILLHGLVGLSVWIDSSANVDCVQVLFLSYRPRIALGTRLFLAFAQSLPQVFDINAFPIFRHRP